MERGVKHERKQVLTRNKRRRLWSHQVEKVRKEGSHGWTNMYRGREEEGKEAWRR